MTALGWTLLAIGLVVFAFVMAAMLLFREPIEADPDPEPYGDVPHVGRDGL